MKGWKFADGQTVDAQSVMFFLNLYKADPSAYCGYNAGYGIPDQVQDRHGQRQHGDDHLHARRSTRTGSSTTTSRRSPRCPTPGTVTGPGQTSTCATGAYGAASTDTACKAVEKYLDDQSSKVTTYTDAMWQSGVDGPWQPHVLRLPRQRHVRAQRQVLRAGQKAHVATVKELAFTSDPGRGERAPGRQGDDRVRRPRRADPAGAAPGQGRAQLVAARGQVRPDRPGRRGTSTTRRSTSRTKDPKSAAVNQLYIRQALQSRDRPDRRHQDGRQGLRLPDVQPDAAQHPDVDLRAPSPTRTRSTLSGRQVAAHRATAGRSRAACRPA